MLDNLLADGAVGLQHDLVDPLRGLDGVGLVVDPLELLKSAALGLDAGNGLARWLLERNKIVVSGTGAYQKKYHRMASTTSQPTNT
jgi:hypothetical protein